jgi:hypothetical protein
MTNITHVATIALCALAVTTAAAAADQGQAPSPAIVNGVKCAVGSTAEAVPGDAFRIIGSQDTVARGLYDRHDLLLINGGSARDLHVDQRFFIRRSAAFGERRLPGPRAVATAGWLRLIAVNDSTAIARVEFACGAIHQGDYLEPYVEPILPPGIDKTDASGQPDFSAPAHVLFGEEERHSAAIGDFVVIDAGTTRGLEAGSRLAVYRQLPVPDLPLAPVGETIVVKADADTALIRITQARDVVGAGDLLFLRKK